MWVVTEIQGIDNIDKYYYHMKENAERKQHKLLVRELNTWTNYREPIKIKFGAIEAKDLQAILNIIVYKHKQIYRDSGCSYVVNIQKIENKEEFENKLEKEFEESDKEL